MYFLNPVFEFGVLSTVVVVGIPPEPMAFDTARDQNGLALANMDIQGYDHYSFDDLRKDPSILQNQHDPATTSVAGLEEHLRKVDDDFNPYKIVTVITFIPEELD